MKIMKKNTVLLSLFITYSLFLGCNERVLDPCDGIVCGQYGVCNTGKCDCTDGYSGTNCSSPPLNINGTWSGVLLADGYTQGFDYTIVINQIAGSNKFSGTSLIVDSNTPTAFAEMTLNGITSSPTSGSISEISILKTGNMTTVGRWCIKKVTFSFVQSGNFQILKGNWSDPNCGDRGNNGTVNLTKIR